MRILVVSQFYYPENFVITRIAEELKKLGHEVTVLTGKPNYGYGYILKEYKKVNFEIKNGVKINRVNLYPRKKSRLSVIFNYLSFWKNSKKWVRKTKEEFDIVYSMSLSPVTILAAGNLYKKLHNVPHVVHCVDLWPESTVVTGAVKNKSIMYKILYNWSKKLYSFSNHIILGSPSFGDYFKNVLRIKSPNFSYIPQPSLIDDVEPFSFSFDKKFTNVLYCGNLGLIQNIDLIVESAKLIVDKPIRINIIGMGPKSQYLEDSIKNFHLENNLVYFGPMPADRAAMFIKGSDFLLASLKDNGYVGHTIPNKLVMYMAFGKPIICMLEGDGKNILIDSDGALFANQTSESLANTLIAAKNIDLSQREKMGQNNLTYYKNNLSVDCIVKKIEEVLKLNIF